MNNIVFRHNNQNNIITFQDGGKKRRSRKSRRSRWKRFKKRSKISRKKESRALARQAKKDEEAKKNLERINAILVPETYKKGSCGPRSGFCSGSRYCDKDGKCGPEKTHKQTVNNPNFKYRLCVGRDSECVRKAICSADKLNEIKCRLVFA